MSAARGSFRPGNGNEAARGLVDERRTRANHTSLPLNPIRGADLQSKQVPRVVTIYDAPSSRQYSCVST